jgi:hypothetical protein
LNTPAPVTAARRTPASPRSSRQRPGRFGVRHVDGLGIEGELARAQARHGDEATGAVGDLDEKVLAFLSGHDAFLCRSVFAVIPEAAPRLSGIHLRAPYVDMDPG